jgi:hypothetical protein
MNLVLSTDIIGPTYTAGVLYVNDSVFCNTLEPQTRPIGIKIVGLTAIPYGTYLVTLEYSYHHGYVVPLLHNVPNFSGIEIHIGNYATKIINNITVPGDTEGCILVGQRDNNPAILSLGSSHFAWNLLMKKLRIAITNREQIWLIKENAT